MTTELTSKDSEGSPAFRRAAIVAVVLLAAMVVRLNAAHLAPIIARDGTVYLEMGRMLDQGHVSTVCHKFQYPPGFPAMIAAGARATGSQWPDGWIRVGRNTSIAMALLSLWMLYLFARRAFDAGAAMLTILFFGLAESFTHVSADVLSDAPAVAFAMCAIMSGFAARDALGRGQWRAVAWAVVAGLAAGAGYLCRPEALLSAVLTGLLLVPRKLPAPGRAIQVACLVALIAAASVGVLPYAAEIGALTHKKSFGDFAWVSAGQAMLANASGPVGLLVAMERVLDRTRAMMGTPVFVLACVCWATWIGKYLLRLRLPDRVVGKVPPEVGMVMAVGTVAITAILTSLEMNHPQYISSRHTLLMVFLLVPCAGSGFSTLVEWTRILLEKSAAEEKGLARRLAAHPEIAVWCWMAAFLVAIGVGALSVPLADKGCYRQIGLQIRQTFGPGQRVLAADCWPAFYADSPVEQFMSDGTRLDEEHDLASPDALYARATGGGFRFVVIGARSPGKNAGIIARLIRDTRFPLIGHCRKGQEAWLFGVCAPTLATGTAPATSASSNSDEPRAP